MSTSSTRIEAAAGSTTTNPSGSPSYPLENEVLSSSSSSSSSTTNQNLSHPMDLAPRGPSVVQLRPVRPVFSTLQTNATKGIPNTVNNNGGSPAIATVTAGTPIISVNRTTPANITLLPARATGQVGLGLGLGLGQVQGNTQGISTTYQITRVRPGQPGQQQPASITVTPLPTSNLGANIRLAGTTMNNGTWLQTSAAGFTPIRAATITVGVGGRPVRPADGKMIHIPQQHVAQLQMVDSKGSILKPQLTTTPIVNIRGTLPGGATSGSSVTLPIQPFTIRTANITNISTIQQRPPAPTTSASNPVHKVITQSQPGHNNPICQFVNNKNVIQAITPLPKLSTVCLTLSTNANLASNTSSPVVAVATRQGSTPSLIMTPSALGAASLPITKVYPVGRDGPPVSIVENIFSSNSSSAVSVSTVNINTTATANTPNASSSSVVVATTGTSQPQHLLVHATPTINVHTNAGLPPPNLAPGSIAPGYFVDKNFHMNIVPHNAQTRPISLEKKIDAKSLPPGSMIIAATTNHPNTVTIPLTPSTAQHLNITHLGQPPGNTQSNPSSSNISTSATSTISQNHHPQLFTQIPITSGSSSTITVTPASSQHQQSIPMPIPAHMISHQSIASSTNVASILTMTVTTTTISSSTSTGSSSMSSSAVTNTSSISSTSATSTSTSSTASAATTTQPAQSPNNSQNANNNTKATHSPRPSILRKRELGDHHHQSHASSRAQKNLSLQLNFSTSNSTNFTSSSNKENSLSLEKFSSNLSTSTSSGGCSAIATGGGSSSISILKKEFQPPTEESSWQSVSSNSSSGSSTISTTSETAELQMQQQLSIGGGVDLNLSTSSPLHSSEAVTSAFVGVGLGSALSSTISGKSTSGGLTVGGLSLGLCSSNTSSSSTSTSQNQNGVLKSTQPRSRSSSTSKGANKDVDRVKNKDKDSDSVSPRKKPRKQQLTSSDLLEAASPEIYYQGKGKRFRKGDLMDFSEGVTEKERVPIDPIPEEPPPPRKVGYVKIKHMSLLQTNSIPPKPLTTHFQRYCDVKAKEEKRPTISELANQKNILQTVSGWRIQHMTAQMEELVQGETNVINKCTAVLNRLESKVGPDSSDRDLNIVMELLKGNIQRCKVIRDQMSESKAQAEKILEHKPHVLEVINKYSTKRPQNKKRDRVL